MKLESFSVKNYRSITQARSIPLTSNTILVGPNNEGKSNILRALNAAMYALSQYSVFKTPGRYSQLANRSEDISQAYVWKRDFPISLQNSKVDKQTKITLNFLLSTEEIDEFKAEIKSNLNGALPVCVTFEERGFAVNIVKQGRGSKSLNEKSDRIAKFLADKIQFQYIPAVRTADQAVQIVEDIIGSELRRLELKPEFQNAIKTIRDIQRPVLDAFSQKTTQTLKAFMPNMKSVDFKFSENRTFAFSEGTWT